MNPSNSKKTLTLESHQVRSFHRGLKILEKNFGAANNSGTGTGKTYLTMAKFLYSGYSMMLCIVPAGSIIMWKEELSSHVIEHEIFSYSVIAGKNGKMNHPYLIKHDDEYFPTEALTNLIKRRILVVYDESQDVKNPKSNRTRACHAIAKEVVRVNNGSRLVSLSATPVDKEDYVESIIKLNGIITTNELFKYNPGLKEYQMAGYGYEQLFTYCLRLNPKLTHELYPKPLSAKMIRYSMFELYTQIVKYEIAFAMPKPLIDYKFNAYNKHYKLELDDLDRMKLGLQELKDLIRYQEDGSINYRSDGIGKIVQSMIVMELSKVNLFYRLVTDTLNYIKGSKVILYVWHDKTVDALMKKLEKYNPLRCDGKVSLSKRGEYRTLFQQDNDDYRLIVAKPTSFGKSISLHDTHGKRERFIFINPNFHFGPIVQAAGRAYRCGTKSDTHVYLTYAIGTDENKVMLALSKKSEITRKCIASYIPDDDEETDLEELERIPDEVPFVDKWLYEYEN